jgi:hypothetical protein
MPQPSGTGVGAARSHRFVPDTVHGWYLRRPGTLETEPPQPGGFAFQVFHGVLDPNVVGLQELVDLVAGLEAKQAP